MRAKTILESFEALSQLQIDDKLKQMSDEPRIQRALIYLAERGAKIDKIDRNQIVLHAYDVFAGNWQIGRAVTPEEAQKIIDIHKQYDVHHLGNEYTYKPVHGSTYLHLTEIEEMIRNERYKIKNIDLGDAPKSRYYL